MMSPHFFFIMVALLVAVAPAVDLNSYDLATCEGAYGLFVYTTSMVCPCAEICTGIGSCDVDRDEEGRCDGDCKDACDPSVCGTDACQIAGDFSIANAESMLEGLATCAQHSSLQGYAEYADLGTTHMSMML